MIVLLFSFIIQIDAPSADAPSGQDKVREPLPLSSNKIKQKVSITLHCHTPAVTTHKCSHNNNPVVLAVTAAQHLSTRSSGGGGGGGGGGGKDVGPPGYPSAIARMREAATTSNRGLSKAVHAESLWKMAFRKLDSQV
jgi:hypothetical protein